MRTTPHKIRQRLFLHFLYLSALLFLVSTFPVLGQKKPKKQLSAVDYHLWSRLTADKISDKGNWVSYSLSYESGLDTLFLKNNKNNSTYRFPGASNGNFTSEKWFACLDKQDRLTILDLSNEKKEVLLGVMSYTLTQDGEFIIILSRDSNNQKQLYIKSLVGKEDLIIKNAALYSYNSDVASVAYTTEKTGISTFGMILLKEKPSHLTIVKTDLNRFSKIVWQDQGKSVAFLQQSMQPDANKNAKNGIGYYRLAEKKLYVFNPDKIENFPKDLKITAYSFSNLLISKDGKRIFFGLIKNPQNNTLQDTLKVQIWNTDDKYLYPAKKIIDAGNNVVKVAVWWPESNQFSQLTDNVFPEIILNGNQKQALIYNPVQHKSQSLEIAPRDIYIHALENGQKKLLIENQPAGGANIFVSPAGKYLTYFKEGNWWIYDFLKESHINLTKKEKTFFFNENFDRPQQGPIYGNPGWTANDSTLFIYDKYDLWEFTPDGLSATRLTNGRENHMQFRIVKQSAEHQNKINFNGLTNGLFLLSQGLLLEAKGKENNGYYLWQKSKGLRPLVLKKKHLSQLRKSKNNNKYIYVEQAYDSPQRLMIQNEKKGTSKEVFQSNSQHEKYAWGKVERINYTNSKGIALAGLLYYPAGYQSDKKYPMIVSIYEKQSEELFSYINPSEYNNVGFNVTNYTTKGYFVLLPDITYEIGNPGNSATDCVIAATNAAVDSASIDSKSIGLIGHSFGGYETDFIITQTNIFTTAVSGAAITDYISGYFTMLWGIAKPNFFQYETWQLRMGKPFFENEAAYRQNSPLFHTPKVETPLLSWTGEKDRQVFYHQSMAFYMALRRLEKKHIMLIYPDEGHVIHAKSNQIDLTRRIEQWFEHYLKKGKQQQWFKSDVLY